MPRNLYVNLPVQDLDRTVDFFAALGFSFNPKFTDENAAAMIVNDGTSHTTKAGRLGLYSASASKMRGSAFTAIKVLPPAVTTLPWAANEVCSRSE